jgi:putative DNA primase/helicase
MSPDFKRWVEEAKAPGLAEVVMQRGGLRLKRQGHRLIGPCPRCGGDDRFYVNTDLALFNCNGCDCGKGKKGAVDFVEFLDGCSFLQACETLTGRAPPKDQSKSHDKKGGNGKPVVVEAYDYRDEAGELHYQIQRVQYAGPDGHWILKGGKPDKTFWQRRPDSRPGHWITNVEGCRALPYLLPELLEALKAGRLIFNVEGERKVDVLRDIGVAATSNSGGSGKWTNEHSAFFPAGSINVILPDVDEAGRKHRDVVAASLIEAGAEVKVLELPGLSGKGDVVDWVEAGGTAERLIELAKDAKPWVIQESGHDRAAPAAPPPQKDDVKALVLRRSAPFDNAGEFIARNFLHHGVTPSQMTLFHHQAVFSRWVTTHYEEIPSEQLDAMIWTFLANAVCYVKDMLVSFDPNSASVLNTRAASAAHAQLTGKVDFPHWIGKAPVPAAEILSCANGLLHLPTRKLLPHTPMLRNTYALDYAFNPEAPLPDLFLQFLTELWPSDPQSTLTLQEIFGLMLTGDTSLQKIFLIIGPRRSGKGTIARVLRAMLGGEVNVAGPTLARLGDTFGLQGLINKPLAIISDARISPKTDIQVIVERLLSISGEDALDVDRKFLSAWSGKLPTRFVILTNVLPKLADASGAITSRFVILTLSESFYGREDTTLTEKLLKELPGILNWSLVGLDRLRKRGHFVTPESSKGIYQAFENLSNPMGVFLEECCDVQPGVSEAVESLYTAWVNWNARQGRPSAGDKQRFGATLHAAVPGLKRVKPRDDSGTGSRQPLYEGIKLTVPKPQDGAEEVLF